MSLGRIVPLSALILLAACTTNPLEVVISRCPAVAVVEDVNTITRFKGDGRTQEDLAYTVSLADVVTSCTEDEDVVQTVDFAVIGRAYDGYDGGAVTLPVFVAVMRDNLTIVSKERFDVTLNLSAGGLARRSETVSVRIPTIDQARTYNYEVLIGFESTPEDAYYNFVR